MVVKRRTTEIHNPQNQASPLTPDSPFDWTMPREIELFNAIIHNKPAGMDKHFNMAAIHNKLLKLGNFEGLTSDAIWERVEKYFDLQRADSIENALKLKYQDRIEFSLPSKEFGKAMAEMQRKSNQTSSSKPETKKAEKNQQDVTNEAETPKNTPGTKRQSRGAQSGSAKRRKH